MAALPRPLTRPLTAVLVLAVAVVALVGGLLLGRGAAADPRITDPVSTGFLRDMSVHHAQAVRMSEVVHRRSDDAGLRYLAFDIMTTQQGQIGMMTGWLDMSGQPTVATGPSMAWTGAPHEGLMPGMATDEEIAALETLPVERMETSFLQLMTTHHVAGVEMAQAAVDLGAAAPVARLAQGMVDGQSSEIRLMERLLTERGEEPAPVEGHDDHAAPAADAHAGH